MAFGLKSKHRRRRDCPAERRRLRYHRFREKFDACKTYEDYINLLQELAALQPRADFL